MILEDFTLYDTTWFNTLRGSKDFILRTPQWYFNLLRSSEPEERAKALHMIYQEREWNRLIDTLNREVSSDIDPALVDWETAIAEAVSELQGTEQDTAPTVENIIAKLKDPNFNFQTSQYFTKGSEEEEAVRQLLREYNELTETIADLVRQGLIKPDEVRSELLRNPKDIQRIAELRRQLRESDVSNIRDKVSELEKVIAELQKSLSKLTEEIKRLNRRQEDLTKELMMGLEEEKKRARLEEEARKKIPEAIKKVLDAVPRHEDPLQIVSEFRAQLTPEEREVFDDEFRYRVERDRKKRNKGRFITLDAELRYMSRDEIISELNELLEAGEMRRYLRDNLEKWTKEEAEKTGKVAVRIHRVGSNYYPKPIIRTISREEFEAMKKRGDDVEEIK